MKLRTILKPAFIEGYTRLIRERGWKAFAKEKGWKILAGVILFYLIRDSILYLLIPFLIAQGFVCG